MTDQQIIEEQRANGYCCFKAKQDTTQKLKGWEFFHYNEYWFESSSKGFKCGRLYRKKWTDMEWLRETRSCPTCENYAPPNAGYCVFFDVCCSNSSTMHIKWTPKKPTNHSSPGLPEGYSLVHLSRHVEYHEYYITLDNTVKQWELKSASGKCYTIIAPINPERVTDEWIEDTIRSCGHGIDFDHITTYEKLTLALQELKERRDN